MINSKAIKILRTFTKEEMKLFEEFINSPFFNKNKNLLLLFDTLKKIHPVYEIENEELFGKVFQNKKHNADSYKKLMSELLSLCDSFLIQLKLSKDSFNRKYFLLKELADRNMDVLFGSNLKKYEEDISDNKLYATFQERIMLEDLKIIFNQSRNTGFRDIECFTEKLNCGLIYFLDQLIAELQGVYMIKKNYNIEVGQILSESFLNNFDIKNFLKHLNIKIPDNKLAYVLLNFIIITLNPEDTKSFFNAKNNLFAYQISNKSSCEDMIGLFDALMNYCNQMVKKGNRGFRDELFEIFKHKYKHLKEFNLTNLLNWVIIKNNASNAIWLNHTDWADEFIKDNINSVPEDIKENLYNYLYSLVELQKKNFEKSLEHASRVKINHHFQKLVVKSITLICYFELDAFESALSSIDSYRHFLTNNVQTDENSRNEFTTFINLYSKLLKIKMNPDEKNLADIVIIKAESEKFKSSHIWILNKIDEYQSLHSKKKILKKNRTSQS